MAAEHAGLRDAVQAHHPLLQRPAALPLPALLAELPPALHAGALAAHAAPLTCADADGLCAATSECDTAHEGWALQLRHEDLLDVSLAAVRDALRACHGALIAGVSIQQGMTQRVPAVTAAARERGVPVAGLQERWRLALVGLLAALPAENMRSASLDLRAAAPSRQSPLDDATTSRPDLLASLWPRLAVMRQLRSLCLKGAQAPPAQHGALSLALVRLTNLTALRLLDMQRMCLRPLVCALAPLRHLGRFELTTAGWHAQHPHDRPCACAARLLRCLATAHTALSALQLSACTRSRIDPCDLLRAATALRDVRFEDIPMPSNAIAGTIMQCAHLQHLTRLWLYNLAEQDETHEDGLPLHVMRPLLRALPALRDAALQLHVPPAAAWLDASTLFSASTELTRLRFAVNHLQGLRALCLPAGVQRLQLRYVAAWNLDPQLDAAWPVCAAVLAATSLRSLSLACDDLEIPADAEAPVSALPELTSVRLEGMAAPRLLSHLLASAPQLLALDLSACWLGSDSIAGLHTHAAATAAALRALAGASSLTSVRLERCGDLRNEADRAALLAALQQLPRLRELRLCGNLAARDAAHGIAVCLHSLSALTSVAVMEEACEVCRQLCSYLCPCWRYAAVHSVLVAVAEHADLQVVDLRGLSAHLPAEEQGALASMLPATCAVHLGSRR